MSPVEAPSDVDWVAANAESDVQLRDAGLKLATTFWAHGVETPRGKRLVQPYRRIGERWHYRIVDNANQDIVLKTSKPLYESPYEAINNGEMFILAKEGRVVTPTVRLTVGKRVMRIVKWPHRVIKKSRDWLHIRDQKRALGELQDGIMLASTGYGSFWYRIELTGQDGAYGTKGVIWNYRELVTGTESFDHARIHSTRNDALRQGNSLAMMRCKQLEAFKRLRDLEIRRRSRSDRRHLWAVIIPTIVATFLFDAVVVGYFRARGWVG